jgi:hypothetical protein
MEKQQELDLNDSKENEMPIRETRLFVYWENLVDGSKGLERLSKKAEIDEFMRKNPDAKISLIIRGVERKFVTETRIKLS